MTSPLRVRLELQRAVQNYFTRRLSLIQKPQRTFSRKQLHFMFYSGKHFRRVKVLLFIHPSLQFDYWFSLQFLSISGLRLVFVEPQETSWTFGRVIPAKPHVPLANQNHNTIEEKIREKECGRGYAPSIRASAPVKSHQQHVSCVLQRATAHFLFHPALRWTLIGSTG